MNFVWEALIILFVGFCLLRIAGKRTVAEMSGLEIITLLSMASLVGHAVSEQQLWKTIVTLSIFVTLLVTVQYLAVKFNFIEKLFIGRGTLVIENGKVIPENLKKLRISIDQLESRLREKGISSIGDVKTGTIEIDGKLGYELMKHAKPVTVGELEKMFPYLTYWESQANQPTESKLFDEVRMNEHEKPINPKWH